MGLWPMDTLLYLNPRDLKRCPYSLRPVRKDTLEYIQFREAIQRGGIDLPLLVRQNNEIVDGTYRWEIALELALPLVPCYIRSLTDFEVLVKQLTLNNNASQTEYARRLWRIMSYKPEMSLDELAHTITKSREWVFRALSLQRLVDKDSLYNGTLPVFAAVELAKLPPDHQKELKTLPGVLTAGDLADTIRLSVRKYLESLKDGRAARNLQTQLDLSPRYRTFTEVVSELKEPSAAVSLLHRRKANTALLGWQAALEWVLRVDADSIAKRRQQFERQSRKDRHPAKD